MGVRQMGSNIAALWAKKVLNGTKTLDDVPNKLREQVEALLNNKAR